MPDSSSNSRHPIYHTSPLTLQELASMRVALCVWLENFRHGCPTPHEFSFRIKLKIRREISRSNKFTKNLPYKQKRLVDLSIDHVNNEIESWYQSWNKTLHLDNIDNCNRFDLVVFGGNGTVHVQDTIANFLEDDFLSNRQKFEIACNRCMEEKVDSIWPLVREKFCLKSLQFDSNPMLYYWIRLKRGELNRIPLEDFDRIEHLMIAKCCDKGDFFAVRYFLNLLNPHDRIDQINQMLQYNAGFKCVKYLLPHLEARIQHVVFGKRLKSITLRFIEDYESIEYTVQTWLYIQNSFTPERFYKDIVEKFTRGYNSCGMKLAGIWSNTPFHLKEYTLENHLSTVLIKLVQRDDLSTYDEDIVIISPIISDADDSFRIAYWKVTWELWLIKIPFYKFNELLETCLVTPKAILKFKRSLPSSKIFRSYCSYLMGTGWYVEMDEILNQLHLTDKQIIRFKKQILASEDPDFSGSRENMEIHSKYIDGVFSGNEALSRDFKESWILSNKAWSTVVASVRCMVRSEDLMNAQSVISVFVSANRQTECKRKLLEVLRNVMVSGTILHDNRIKLKPFLLWCMEGDAQRVDDFWATLPIDDIFEAMFLKQIEGINETLYRQRSGPRVDRKGSELNQFLKWYFEPKPEFENFKREKIEYYERMDETEVRDKFGKDKRLVIDVMKEGFLMADDEVVDLV